MSTKPRMVQDGGVGVPLYQSIADSCCLGLNTRRPSAHIKGCSMVLLLRFVRMSVQSSIDMTPASYRTIRLLADGHLKGLLMLN